MAIYRNRSCTTCGGSGYVSKCEVWEYENGLGGGQLWSEPCQTCHGTGIVSVALTNSERLLELRTPEDQLRFFRGFKTWAKYVDNPLRLLNPEESDEDMLIWLRKISDESDDCIFENR